MWAEEGLSTVPLFLDWRHGWASVVMGKLRAVTAFLEASQECDMDAMGRLLGYPACCRRMFDRRCDHFSKSDDFVDAPGAVSWMNALDLDFGPTFHLPCRADCRPTAALVTRFREVAISEGFQAQMDWLQEMTSWPVIHSRRARYDDLRVSILCIRRPRRIRARVASAHHTCARFQ